ncbi:MAG: collagen-like protein [Enterocloster bolteae]
MPDAVRAFVGNFKGPKGEQGPQGIQGPTGPQGIQGPAGPSNADGIDTVDTSGVLVSAGESTDLQRLIDAIADKVMTKLLAKTDIVQVESTATNKVPSSAYLKQVKDSIDSNLVNLSGIMPSSTENRKKVADYPDGFSQNNIKYIVSIIYRTDISAWVTLSDGSTTFYLMADGIYAYTSNTNFSQKQFKLALCK